MRRSEKKYLRNQEREFEEFSMRLWAKRNQKKSRSGNTQKKTGRKLEKVFTHSISREEAWYKACDQVKVFLKNITKAKAPVAVYDSNGSVSQEVLPSMKESQKEKKEPDLTNSVRIPKFREEDKPDMALLLKSKNASRRQRRTYLLVNKERIKKNVMNSQQYATVRHNYRQACMNKAQHGVDK